MVDTSDDMTLGGPEVALSQRRAMPRTVRLPGNLVIGDDSLPVTVVHLSTRGAEVWLDPGRSLSVNPVQASPLLFLTLPGSTAPLRIVCATTPCVAVDDIDHRGRTVRRLALGFSPLTKETRLPLQAFLASQRPLVLAIGLESAAELCEHLSADARFALLLLRSAAEVAPAIDAQEVAAVVFGPALEPEQAARSLRDLSATFPGAATRNVVLAAGSDRALFQDLVDDDHIFYFSEAPGRAVDVTEVVASAARHRHAARSTDRAAGPEEAERQLRDLGVVRRLSSQSDLLGAVQLLERWIVTAFSVERAYVLVYEHETDTLWAPAQHDKRERRESASTGLAAWTLRTSTSLQVERPADDPRYDREADDPVGDGSGCFVAIPIAAGEAAPVAVLVLIRRAGEQFAVEELDRLRGLATETAPILARFLAEREAWITSQQPFRQEAFTHQMNATALAGDALRLSPRSAALTYPLLVMALIAGVTYTMVASVHEVATGPGIVRLEDRTEVIATHAGVVVSALVHLGARVSAGGLVARIGQGELRAPSDGLVLGVHVRIGQRVEEGDPVVSLVDDRVAHVVATLPARYRPSIGVGTQLQVVLQGQERTVASLPIESVSEVLSAEEAARYTGLLPPNDSVVRSNGARLEPVVVVRARISQAAQENQDSHLRYHDGMQVEASVLVRSERLAATLVPALRRFLPPNDR